MSIYTVQPITVDSIPTSCDFFLCI